MLLAYYGDDFTGSTDALEALATRGVPTVLFTEPPSQAMLERFPHAQAVGIAGNSRTMSPDQMEAALPAAFQSLASLRPKFVHYKVCSTFDSSPQVGSIGRAIEIGQRVFQNRWVPVVIGAPNLQRFCLFGNLFARSGLDSPVYRLDRHPTMSRHPVTPMTEADIRVHLSHQTSLPVGLVDVLALDRDAAATTEMPSQRGIVLFDTLTDGHLATIGELLAKAQVGEQKPLFLAGSSGIETALTKEWKSKGELPSESKGFAPPLRVEPVVVVSGSCSPVTGRQIDWAVENGFVDLPLDTVRLTQSNALDAEIAAAIEHAVAQLDRGRSVIVHTCRGPEDGRIAASRQFGRPSLTGCTLGDILGRILGEVLRSQPVKRVAVAGGDTSGAVARTIGIEALEMVGPLAPGAPLCVARSERGEVDGVEFTFKGGQVGHDDFFGSLIRGGQIARR